MADEVITRNIRGVDGTADGNQINFSEFIGISSKFADLNKLITRDLNNNVSTPTFSLFTKDNINEYLKDPYRYEKELRQAVLYIYGASPHFRRLIQYFTSLSDFAYIVSPYKIDPKKTKPKTISRNYRNVMNLIQSLSVKTQLPKIVTVCLREDVFYGTLRPSNDSTIIQQLPSDYCAISTVEGNVPNVTFDFSYFDSRAQLLDYYPQEFKQKYSIYQKNRTSRWIELDSPTSFAVKANEDILEYAVPPFVGVLRELYDLEDYRQLKISKTALENYAMIAMTLPMSDDGEWGIDLKKAKEFWRNLDSVLPPEIGSILSPMKLEKINFDHSNTGGTNTIAEAEQSVFTAAGVNSLLFNNEKASANALSLSVKVDQAMTFGIVKGIENALNRYIHSLSYGKNFKLTFLDCSPFNRKELGDAYIKAASYGLPTISMYAATQGLNQSELDSMSFLETEVLGLQDMFKPIVSSTQLSSSDLDSEAATPEGGRPVAEDVTDSGEQTREQRDDWG